MIHGKLTLCPGFIIGFLLQSIQSNPVQFETCGRVLPKSSKILSGENAHPTEFPWMVSIKSNVNGAHFCGGFVVNSHTIISAAHCFFRKYNTHLVYNEQGVALPSSISISAGQHDLSGSGAAVTIESISLHSDFEKGGHLNNDIAILKTRHPIRVTPICLPSGVGHDASFGTGDLVTVAGWGNTNCHNSKILPSKTLKKVSIPIWKAAECLQAYQDAHYDFTREDYVCAGDDGKDSSKGDSGGPLMHLESSGNWIAIGIVSAGRFMCEDRVPGVYTKISSYLDWIREQVL